jgi:hypothetical protein
LKEQEKIVLEAGDLDSAQKVHNELNELKEKEILLRNILVIEQNQKAVS